MKDITIEIDGLTGKEVNEDYVRALMAAIFHPSVSVVSVGLGVRNGWGILEGEATVKVAFNYDENPILKFLLGVGDD